MTRVPDLRRPVRKTPLLSCTTLSIFVLLVGVLAWGLLFGRFRGELDDAILGSRSAAARPAAHGTPGPPGTPAPPKLTISKLTTRPIGGGLRREVDGMIRNDSNRIVKSIVVHLAWIEAAEEKTADFKVTPDELYPGGSGSFGGVYGTWQAKPIVASAVGAATVTEWEHAPGIEALPIEAPATAAPAAPPGISRRVSEDALCLSFDAVPDSSGGSGAAVAEIAVMIRNGCDHAISRWDTRFHVVARATDGTSLAEADGLTDHEIPAQGYARVRMTLYCDPSRVYRYFISRVP